MIPENQRTPLVKHVERHLYSYPNMTHSYQLKLNQVSPNLGYVNHFSLMGRSRHTPIKDEYFLIFNLSGLDLSYWNFQDLINQTDPRDKWLNVAAICKTRQITVDIYADDGRLYPRDKCWVISTYDGQKLLAVRNLRVFQTSWRKPMYLHCYTVQTTMTEHDGTRAYIQYASNEGNSASEINRLSEVYHRFLALKGLTTVYLNGHKWGRFPVSADLKDDDVIEVVNDPSVIDVETFSVKTLPNYYSSLDEARKFILHSPKDEGFGCRLLGDCDFFLLNENNQGVYLNRNEIGFIRQLTHRDFGVNTPMVRNLENTTGILKEKDLKIQVIARKNDYLKPFPHENSGIRYLYRMDDQNIVGALIDVNSTVKEWRADELERSESMLILRRPYLELSQDRAIDAYGYNAATQILGKTTYSIDGVQGVELKVPAAARDHVTMFEYDEHGLFLRKRYYKGMDYVVPSNDAKLVELYPGKPGYLIHHTYGTNPVTLDGTSLPRFYVQNVTTAGDPVGGIVLAKEGKDYTFDPNSGKVEWKLNPNLKTGLIVYDDWTLYKEFTLKHMDNSLSFSITHQWEGGGMIATIAPANVTVIMNRRTLIENVDYVVRFPDVYIVNHQYLSEDGSNDFVLYCSGWSPISDNEVVEDTELGYVMGGVIGMNTVYNLREDRVTKTIIDGRLWDPDKVPSAELNPPSDLFNRYNGFPYAVKHWYLPLKGWKQHQPYYGYTEARDRDQRMSDYLTTHAEKPIPEVIPSINDKYRLFSPFMNAVVNQLLLGVIELYPLNNGESYPSSFVYDQVDKFKWWLDFDPVTRGMDYRYFTVFPYVQKGPVTLTPDQYVFIHRVNELFLQHRVNINGHFEVKHV